MKKLHVEGRDKHTCSVKGQILHILSFIGPERKPRLLYRTVLKAKKQIYTAFLLMKLKSK